MLEKEEDESGKFSIKIEEYNLDPERNSFEDELRKSYSKKDIMHCFDSITETKITGWENKLFESKLPIRDFSNVTDPDIINEECSDQKISKLINCDIERTRVQESIYMNNFKDYVLKILVYYINKNNISYKQGLNEIVGPFILLKYKFKISFSSIYKIFVCFVDKFLTNYFHEKEFYSLRSSLSLINLLLRYHDTELFHQFEKYCISPDLYATAWIITLFSSRCTLNVTYYLWDKLILFDDSLFPLFFIVALLIINKQKFFNIDSTIILSILCQLQIKTIEEVNEILDYATMIREKTPNSFYILANKLEIFNFDSKNLENSFKTYKPDKMLALPIFSNELFFILNIIGCPDERCEHFLNNKKFNDLSKCFFCRTKDLRKNIYYIILDLRIFEDEDNNKSSESFPGYLPKTLRVKTEELRDPTFPKNILNKYKVDKDKYQFILITSETGYFEEYENKFYRYKGKRNSKLDVFYKKNTEIDIDKVKEVFEKKKGKKKDYLLLKEYDNFRKIINEMNNEKFQYVSYVYGGFKDIHSFAKKNKIDLMEHGKNCILCKE